VLPLLSKVKNTSPVVLNETPCGFREPDENEKTLLESLVNNGLFKVHELEITGGASMGCPMIVINIPAKAI
jgi:hypothetical protein